LRLQGGRGTEQKGGGGSEWNQRIRGGVGARSVLAKLVTEVRDAILATRGGGATSEGKGAELGCEGVGDDS